MSSETRAKSEKCGGEMSSGSKRKRKGKKIKREIKQQLLSKNSKD